jgi:hypothetical protein
MAPIPRKGGAPAAKKAGWIQPNPTVKVVPAVTQYTQPGWTPQRGAAQAIARGYVTYNKPINVKPYVVPPYTQANRQQQQVSAQRAVNRGWIAPNPTVNWGGAGGGGGAGGAGAAGSQPSWANPYAALQKQVGQILTPAQMQAQAGKYASDAINAQLAAEKSSSALEQQQLMSQATRANEMAKALGQISAPSGQSIQDAYMQAARFEQGLGTGLTGDVAASQQQAADQASQQISQMTGGLANQVGGYDIPAERSVSQLTGVVMPARNLAEQAANASTLTQFQRGANIQQVGAIARDYIQKASDASAAAAAERAKIIATRPDLTDKQVQALQANRQAQVNSLVNLAQGTVQYHQALNQQQNQAFTQAYNLAQLAQHGSEFGANLAQQQTQFQGNLGISQQNVDISKGQQVVNALNSSVNRQVALSNADVQVLNSDVNRRVALKNAATSAVNAATSAMTAKGNQTVNMMNAVRQMNSAATYDAYLNSKITNTADEFKWKKQYDAMKIKLDNFVATQNAAYQTGSLGVRAQANAIAAQANTIRQNKYASDNQINQWNAYIKATGKLPKAWGGGNALGTYIDKKTGQVRPLPTNTIIGPKGVPIDATPSSGPAAAKVQVPSYNDLQDFGKLMKEGVEARLNPGQVNRMTRPQTVWPRKRIVEYLMNNWGNTFLGRYPTQKKQVMQAVDAAASNVIAQYTKPKGP